MSNYSPGDRVNEILISDLKIKGFENIARLNFIFVVINFSLRTMFH